MEPLVDERGQNQKARSVRVAIEAPEGILKVRFLHGADPNSPICEASGRWEMAFMREPGEKIGLAIAGRPEVLLTIEVQAGTEVRCLGFRIENGKVTGVSQLPKG